MTTWNWISQSRYFRREMGKKNKENGEREEDLWIKSGRQTFVHFFFIPELIPPFSLSHFPFPLYPFFPKTISAASLPPTKLPSWLEYCRRKKEIIPEVGICKRKILSEKKTQRKCKIKKKMKTRFRLLFCLINFRLCIFRSTTRLT